MDINSIKIILIGGLILGSLYSIMAFGLSLVWGTLRMYNFAHGSLIMLGAFIAWSLFSIGGYFFVIIPSIIILFFVGITLEKVLIEPFFDKPDSALKVVITTLAGFILIDNIARNYLGVRLKQLPPILEGTSNILSINISNQEILIIVLAPIICILLSFFLKYSRIGLAIQQLNKISIFHYY